MKNNLVYDYAVIGGGLSGLCIAHALAKLSTKVVLIEAQEDIGGLNKVNQTAFGALSNGIRFLPDSDLSRKSLSFLEAITSSSLATNVVEAGPVTFEDGQIKPFVGFGEKSPAFYKEIAYFLSASRVECDFDWIKLLNSNMPFQVLNRSHVTKFTTDGNQITAAVINNGQKEIQAQNFVYCGSIKDLDYLLPTDSLSTKARQKLAKSNFGTAVCLDLVHGNEITQSNSVHVLDSTTENEFGPCVGLFSQVEGKQISQWVSFVQDEDIENSETTGAALKKMKRQIKRAYPEVFDKVLFERVLVAPSFSGNGDLKISANQTLPTHNNFWIGSAGLNPQQNLLGALLQAELVISAMGAHPQGHQIQIQEQIQETGIDLE